jgi:hypothetical protein
VDPVKRGLGLQPQVVNVELVVAKDREQREVPDRVDGNVPAPASRSSCPRCSAAEPPE